jgi:ParB family chromosome partitioning protein
LILPVVVSPDLRLIAGYRRLQAVKKLGWPRVPVVVVTSTLDALARLRAEFAENTCRKDFVPSEAVAIGQALAELERPKAKERQGRPGQPRSGKLPDRAEAGQTRDRVAAALGMSGRTYDKARRVVEAAQRDPERFGYVQEEMDRTGKVDRAFRAVIRARAEAPLEEGATSPQASREVRDFRTQVATVGLGCRALMQAPLGLVLVALDRQEIQRLAEALDKDADQLRQLAGTLRLELVEGGTPVATTTPAEAPAETTTPAEATPEAPAEATTEERPI